ncbi:hypothetical protein KY345_05915 [Candidatus Woesearchaeota archaeon]|nr:hypothetical protein [Candidatus Woesearchaeota archaeon]
MFEGIYKKIKDFASREIHGFTQEIEDSKEIWQFLGYAFNPVTNPMGYKAAGLFSICQGVVNQNPTGIQIGIATLGLGELGDKVKHDKLERRVSELEPKIKGTLYTPPK